MTPRPRHLTGAPAPGPRVARTGRTAADPVPFLQSSPFSTQVFVIERCLCTVDKTIGTYSTLNLHSKKNVLFSSARLSILYHNTPQSYLPYGHVWIAFLSGQTNLLVHFPCQSWPFPRQPKLVPKFGRPIYWHRQLRRNPIPTNIYYFISFHFISFFLCTNPPPSSALPIFTVVGKVPRYRVLFTVCG